MNRFYDKALEMSWNFVSDDIRAVLVDTAVYTPNFATDNYLDDIAAGARIGPVVALTSKSNTAGVLDAADVLFSSMPTSKTVNALVLYKHTGTDSTSPLWMYFDGKFQIEIAYGSATSATTIYPEDLPAAIANGATLTKISGTGQTTITLTAAGAEGDRTLTVSALSGTLGAGAVYEYTCSNGGYPFTTPGTTADYLHQWGNGADKIVRL
jgi:hypothetical protein